MSNLEPMWTEQQRAQAAEEGWELGLVVDEGKPVQTAYLDVFDAGPRFPHRRAAMMFVYEQAKGRSKLHIAALSACSSSRVHSATQTQKRR